MHVMAVIPFILALWVAVVNSALCGNGTNPLQLFLPSEIDELSACHNVTSDIIVHGNELNTVVLRGVTRIDGSLIIVNSTSVESIYAPDLQWISSKFQLTSLPSLRNISFPLLETVVEGVHWSSLPLLTEVGMKKNGVDAFNNAGTNIYGDLLVQNCTCIKQLDFFNFGSDSSRTRDVSITQNPSLTNINLTQLTFADNIEILGNSPKSYVLVPRLVSATNLHLEEVNNVDLSTLSKLDKNLVVKASTIGELRAPLLTAVGGDLAIEDNVNLSKLDLPLLKTIGNSDVDGNFRVIENNALQELNLNNLSYIDGMTNLTGHFNRVLLPSLKEISEGFYVHTLTNDKFNCSSFDRLFYNSNENSAPAGWYRCSANSPSSPLRKDLASHSKNPNSKNWDIRLEPQSMALAIAIPVVICLGILVFLIRCGYKRKTAARDMMSDEEGSRRSSVTMSDTRTEPGTDRTESRASEDIDRQSEEKLPPYRRRGRLGEVPPEYPHGDAPQYDDVVRIDSNEITEVPPAITRMHELEMTPSQRSLVLRGTG